jgi:hypothetical protein
MFSIEKDIYNDLSPGKNGADCSAPSSILSDIDVLFSSCRDI